MSAERPWNLAVRSVGSEEIEVSVYDVIGASYLGSGVTAKDILAKLRSAPNARKISLRVNSVGGIVDEAKAMVNLLNERASNGVTIVATIDGIAASAASYLLTAATKVVMPSNAFLMIHGVRGGVRGTASDLESAAALFRRTNEQLAEAYAAASAKRGVNKSKADYLAAFAAGDLYLDADQAIAWGLADEKLAALKVAASLVDIGELDHDAPAALKAAVYVTASVPAAHAPQILTASPRKIKMNKIEIQAAYPEAFASILADGVASERRRVKAHLTMGSKSGAAAYALQCIESGSSVTDEDVFAEYTSSAISVRDRNDRQADSDFAGAIMAGAKGGSGAPSGAPGATAPDGEELLAMAADIYCGKKA